MQNLFIALIVDDFTIVVAREYNELAMEHVSQWLVAWSQFATDRAQNPEADGPAGIYESCMGLDHFVEMLKHVPEPLGVGLDATDAEALQRMEAIGVRMHLGGKLFFLDTLKRAVNRVAIMVNPTTRMDIPHLQQQYVGTAYVAVLSSPNPTRRSKPSDGLRSPAQPATTRAPVGAVPPMRLFAGGEGPPAEEPGEGKAP